MSVTNGLTKTLSPAQSLARPGYRSCLKPLHTGFGRNARAGLGPRRSRLHAGGIIALTRTSRIRQSSTAARKIALRGRLPLAQRMVA
jgi:hypothetical protein